METEKKDIMKSFRQKSGKKKKIAIVIAVVLVLAIVVVSSINKRQEEMMEQVTSAMQQTDVVSTRSLVKSIGATGTIVSLDSKNITSTLTGTDIESITVEVGDSVEEGAILLTFDSSDIEENLKDAKDALADAKTKNAISQEDAARNVTDAERTREYQIASAQDNLTDAYVNYGNSLGVYHNLLDELENLKKNNADEESIRDQEEEIEDYLETLESMKRKYDAAQRNYDNTVASQDSTVAKTINSQTTTLLNLTTDTQENQVELYQEQLEKAVLCAPFSGIVTAVNYDAGDTYSGGTLITIQDCSSFEIEAQISEYDISDVKLGQKVLIKTNATGDEEMEGTVSFISPTATSSAAGMTSSDVNYEIRVAITNPSDRLRLDMSASLSIIVEEHDNVMTVPYNAVQEKEDGSSYVMVKESDGTFREVSIEVVMESNYYTEITSNELSDGMEVLVIETEGTSLMDLMTGGGFGGRGGF